MKYENLSLEAAEELIKGIGKPDLAKKLKSILDIYNAEKAKEEERKNQQRIEEEQRRQEIEKKDKAEWRLLGRIGGATLGLIVGATLADKIKNLDTKYQAGLIFGGPVLGYSAVRAYQHFKNKKK